MLIKHDNNNNDNDNHNRHNDTNDMYYHHVYRYRYYSSRRGPAADPAGLLRDPGRRGRLLLVLRLVLVWLVLVVF